jgi:hypothetical protein
LQQTQLLSRQRAMLEKGEAAAAARPRRLGNVAVGTRASARSACGGGPEAGRAGAGNATQRARPDKSLAKSGRERSLPTRETRQSSALV